MTESTANAFQMRQVALVISQSVAAQIRLAGMLALNSERERRGETLAYDEAAFEAVIQEFGLGWNTVVTTLNS